MRPIFRISTSPTNDWDGDPDEASHYCDLQEVVDWRESPLLGRTTPAIREEALRSGVAGYAVAATHADREVGLLVLIEEEDGKTYLGIDLDGRTSRQPAANEALWDAANRALRGAYQTR